MAIYLESASLDETAAAAALGFVRGITTNPTLMAREAADPLERLARILVTFPTGPVLYQPGTAEPGAAEREARTAVAVAPERVVVKLPARLELFTLAQRLVAEGLVCAMTAVYAPAQAVVAHEVGCAWVIPYVDRARRSSPQGDRLVRSLAEVLAALSSGTRILAGSLKSPEQVAAAVAAGARDVTVPMPVLVRLAEHPLSGSAIAEFERAAARGPEVGQVSSRQARR